MRYSTNTEKKKAEYVANNIGISGLKYVLGTNVSKLRRLVWLVVILLASAWMIWNIQGRVIYFLSRPSAITTEIKFEDKLMFPKVTICNQNTFRSSKVYEEDHSPRKSPTVYEAIDRYMRVLSDGIGNQSLTQNVVDKYDAILSNNNTMDFYWRTAHQKTEMIQSCTWKGRPCGPENFTEVLTNMGICFQLDINPEDLTVDQINKEGGLTLDLFVEQFDYMRDPQTRAGVLVVITDHNETEALAKEQGIGFSVGQYVSIGLQRSEVTDLPPPHGKCGSAELENYPPDEPYTYQKCHLNCLTSFIKSKCGCVSVHMPGQDVPVCSFLKNLECVKPNEELFYQTLEINYCVCPSPCKSVIYSPSTSIAEFSDTFKRRLPLSEPSVSIDDVNRATMIQAWSLFNTINPHITDHLAQMGVTLKQYKTVLLDLFPRFAALMARVQNLMVFVSDRNITLEIMMAVKPEQEANVTWNELESFMGNYGYQGHRSLIKNSPIWHSEFVTDIELNIIEDLFEIEDLYRTLFLRQIYTEMNIKAIDKYRDLVINLESAVSAETSNISISGKNITALIESVMGLLSQVEKLEWTCSEQIDKWYGQYGSTFEEVRAVATQTYFRLTSQFFSDNLLKLEIFFTELGVQTSQKSPAYSAEGLVCDIGGSIGLCLGGSILTLVEVCDIIVIIYGSRRKGKPDASPSGNKDVA